MKMKEEIHKCGNGFKGVVRTIKRPGIGALRFCGFCGKEFRL